DGVYPERGSSLDLQDCLLNLAVPANPRRDLAVSDDRVKENRMRIQRLAIFLSVLNFVLLIVILAVLGRPAADIVPVLRGHALEIVDEQGKGRTQIVIAPSTTSNGVTYPEMVLFRLSDPNGRPAVKLSASVDGAILDLSGDSAQGAWSGVQILGN